MCNCRKNRPTETYTVTYPDGSTATRRSEVAAKLAASAVPGATYTKQ